MANTWSQWISNPIVNLSVLLVRIHIELMIHLLKKKHFLIGQDYSVGRKLKRIAHTANTMKAKTPIRKKHHLSQYCLCEVTLVSNRLAGAI